MAFTSIDRYIVSRDLEVAVNAALTLQRPLLVKGEPGTGKTVLAQEVARALGRPLIEWHIKSTTKAQHGLCCRKVAKSLVPTRRQRAVSPQLT